MLQDPGVYGKLNLSDLFELHTRLHTHSYSGVGHLYMCRTLAPMPKPVKAMQTPLACKTQSLSDLCVYHLCVCFSTGPWCVWQDGPVGPV
jgi:hypothetical protein